MDEIKLCPFCGSPGMLDEEIVSIFPEDFPSGKVVYCGGVKLD